LLFGGVFKLSELIIQGTLETDRQAADLNLYGFVQNDGVNQGDKLGLWIFKGACRYISGGEIFGGGALRCMMWTECYKDADGLGSIVQSAEVIATFVGLAAGLPGSITFFSIALDDGIYHGKPDINNLTGLSYLISASSALIGGISWSEIKLGKGRLYDKVGDQIGIDASTDLFVGSTAIEGEIKLRCCDKMNEILEEADFLP